ncbi:MAG TPA: folylpolyglutamate synthase/dihydrofolate synthase family protein [Bacteroidota bacterium]|nr:folylpolyglutamate synthase/dihydrofolate synthase family protein [Bacteroidota bacterium]
MSRFEKTIQFLYDLQLFGIKVGLKNIRTLCGVLNHPEREFPSIHIAGTNGKGSTASMIASILSASGYRTGLYTSPHLLQFNERIRIDGKQISDEEIGEYTKFLTPAINKMKATFFEATTAIAFKHFADRNIDIAVIETGLGGRLDATNVVTPLLSIITNIGLDHTEYLGSTYAHVAREKGGIIKKGIPCLTATTEPSALKTLERIAKARDSQLFQAETASDVEILESTLRGLKVTIRPTARAGFRLRLNIPSRTPRGISAPPQQSVPHSMRDFGSASTIRNLILPLPGSHQIPNLQLALLAIQHLKEHMGFNRISSSNIRKGLAKIRRFSGIRGRLDIIRLSPLVIADVAHNPAAVSTLVDVLSHLINRKCLVVFGVMKDKDYLDMARRLAHISRLTIAVQPATDRALASREIARIFRGDHAASTDGGSVAKGLATALRRARDKEPILVTGSHFVVGEAMKHLGVKV